MVEHSDNFPDAFYRVTIKGMCVRDGKLMMVRESQSLSGGKWELPGGGLDFGEDIYIGLQREAQEEMGLHIKEISRIPVYVWTHKFEQHRNLDWFYTCVIAYRVEFENLDFTPTEECEEISFFTKEEISSLDLGGQMEELPDIFNPEDFKSDF